MIPISAIILKIDHTNVKQRVQRNTMNHVIKVRLGRKINKNKITTQAILYCTITKFLPLRLELNFKRTYFIICQSPLPTALCIRL